MIDDTSGYYGSSHRDRVLHLALEGRVPAVRSTPGGKVEEPGKAVYSGCWHDAHRVPGSGDDGSKCIAGINGQATLLLRLA